MELIERAVEAANQAMLDRMRDGHVIVAGWNDVEAITKAAIRAMLDGVEPVAWKWRYVRKSGPSGWLVRQTPIQATVGTDRFAAVEVEALYSLDALKEAVKP